MCMPNPFVVHRYPKFPGVRMDEADTLGGDIGHVLSEVKQGCGVELRERIGAMLLQLVDQLGGEGLRRSVSDYAVAIRGDSAQWCADQCRKLGGDRCGDLGAFLFGGGFAVGGAQCV